MSHIRPSRLADQRGTTVIELMVSMTIYAIVLIGAIAIFVSIANSTTKTTSQRKVQQDIRYSIEEVSRRARTSSINYLFYEVNASNAECALASGKVLALTTTELSSAGTGKTRNMYYYYPGNAALPDGSSAAIYRLEDADAESIRTCSDFNPAPAAVQAKVSDGTYTRVTADNVSITAARFLVTPDRNPYDPGSASDPYRTVHPRVTMTVTAATKAATSPGVTAQSQYSQSTMQTTVSTRAFPMDKPYGQPDTAAAPAPPSPDPNAAARLRDARRKSDLAEILTKLKAFQTANGGIPTTPSYGGGDYGGWDYSSYSLTGISHNNRYLRFLGPPGTIPVDPINDGRLDVVYRPGPSYAYSGTGYAYGFYCYRSADGWPPEYNGRITLVTWLELPESNNGNQLYVINDTGNNCTNTLSTT